MTGASHRQLLVPQRSLTSSVKRLLSLTLFIPSKIVRNHSFVVFVLVFLANLGLRHNKPVKWLNVSSWIDFLEITASVSIHLFYDLTFDRQVYI